MVSNKPSREIGFWKFLFLSTLYTCAYTALILLLLHLARIIILV